MKKYGELTTHFPPSPRLERAVSYALPADRQVINVGKAIDIGAGSLRNSKYLLDKGFDVIAIDTDEGIVSRAQELKLVNVDVRVADMREFQFPLDTFDIAVEDKSFLSKEEILEVMSDMEVLDFYEKEKDGINIRGLPKRWHIFEVIARKI